MAHHPYPETLPVECITEIIRTVRQRKIAEDAANFANCLWTVVGFGLKVGVGEATHEDGPFGAADVSVEQLDECHNALAEASTLSAAEFGADDPNKLDPATIALLIQLAMQIITAWLNRKKTA